MKFYERVISDFGGYEKCKDILSQPNIDFIMNVQALRKHMLEYRRQHNIFEVGDLVVEITDYPSSDVLTVKSLSDKLLVCESDDFNASYVLSSKYEPCFYVRHATNDEIKVGHRL